MLQNGFEQPSEGEMHVPLKEVSSKHNDPSEYVKGIPITYGSPIPELVSKVVHRTTGGKTAKRYIDKKEKRYWTAEGTIRNVPVGAGKRKNKPLDLQYCQAPVAPNAVSSIQTNINLASDVHFSSSDLPGTSRPVTSGAFFVLGMHAKLGWPKGRVFNGTVFKSFEPKSNANSDSLDDNQILKANPAALSRSESFLESM
ncbi:hypothetical protein RIF29_28401 [Crotalaria pallida]|uniref:Dof-type domain-containing protein n=1 Tax=Crotalaria pallida TaxID=3830 RepID=A0AAN9ECL2_CROPI